MSCGHILVQRLNSIGSCHLSVLLVHVVGAGAGVVSNPDTKVLDLEGSLLVDLVESDNLAVRLLDFSQLHQEVPESRLGHDIVGSEDAHAVQLGFGVGVSRQMTADDLVFLEATCSRCVSRVFLQQVNISQQVVQISNSTPSLSFVHARTCFEEESSGCRPPTALQMLVYPALRLLCP